MYEEDIFGETYRMESGCVETQKRMLRGDKVNWKAFKGSFHLQQSIQTEAGEDGLGG